MEWLASSLQSIDIIHRKIQLSKRPTQHKTQVQFNPGSVFARNLFMCAACQRCNTSSKKMPKTREVNSHTSQDVSFRYSGFMSKFSGLTNCCSKDIFSKSSSSLFTSSGTDANTRLNSFVITYFSSP